MVLTEEFDRALELLHSGHDLFLTGKAGTGKSTLIRRFLSETDQPTLVAAPTGIAALNVGGYTIHRLFGFHPGHTVEHVRSNAYRPGRFTQALAGAHTLVLDEVSMLRADVFDMIAIALERFGPDPTMRFGGVRLILVGDLFQLPPVVTASEKSSFEATYPTPYFFSAEHYDPADFPTVDLTHVFRQSGDPELTAILNSIREGTLVGAARERLNSRTDPSFAPPDDEFWLTLATTNNRAARHNQRRLERLPGSDLASEATVTGDLTGFELPTQQVLTFKIGAQIMMLTNDPADRWVNGSIGRVVDVTLGRRGDRGERGPVVVVEFTGGEVADVALHTWDVTRPDTAGGALRHEVVGSFTQLPFTLAWAVTIHKSQGQTLDRVVVDLSGGTFAAGQLYVALSRCRSLEGLVLTRPVLPGDLKTDRRIIRFLRSPGGRTSTRRYCAIAVLTVGEDGPRSKSRPVELAVVFPDGTGVTTLVNPQRDLARARTECGISVADVLLAPTLFEAWAMLAPLMDGYTPVGVDLDATFGQMVAEFARLGREVSMPLGIDIRAEVLSPGERARSRAGSALIRARAALTAHGRLVLDDAAAGTFDADLIDEAPVSYLLSRDTDVRPPTSTALPQLSAVLAISADVGAALLDRPVRDGRPGIGGDDDGLVTPGDRDLVAGARELVAEQIRLAAQRVPMTADVIDRLRMTSRIVGTDLTRGLEVPPTAGPADILRPGARVCFSGSALDSSGVLVSREEMEALAARHHLVPVGAVTKSRCDALVVAEAGSQSVKARAAHKWGTPVLTAADFLDWAGH
ncbi:AAA family ATPase [Dietzia sp. ANT_WB102]|nr:AAA family ATPase [Dietzia sp. ANT_WB102]